MAMVKPCSFVLNLDKLLLLKLVLSLIVGVIAQPHPSAAEYFHYNWH